MVKDIQLYSVTADFLDRLYADCAAAKQRIIIQQYILRDDTTGRALLSLLADKAAAGVEVDLLLDKVGARTVYNSPYIGKIRDNGGRVTFYNDIGWLNLFRPSTWFPRTHLKFNMIDGDIVYVGGACLAHHMRTWQDLVARITGMPTTMFENTVPDHPTARDKKFLPPVEMVEGIGYILADPDDNTTPIYDMLIEKIERAEHTIDMVTPFFIPPPRLHEALMDALSRSVRLRLIVSDDSDVPVARNLTRSMLPEFIEKGMQAHHYQPSIIHAKYVIVDNKWATLGSTNLDYLSLLTNREANLVIEDEEVIQQMEALYADTLHHCEILRESCWRDLSFLNKLRGYAGYLMKEMM